MGKWELYGFMYQEFKGKINKWTSWWRWMYIAQWSEVTVALLGLGKTTLKQSWLIEQVIQIMII